MAASTRTLALVGIGAAIGLFVINLMIDSRLDKLEAAVFSPHNEKD
jgi:hypothetical protein